MNLQHKINISYVTNPLSEKAWSGTPSNIVQVLKSKNLLGNVIITGVSSSRMTMFLKIISKVYYYCKIGFERGIFFRKYYQKRNINNSRVENSPILHFSTLDLPTVYASSNNHFLFCDSSWNIYCKHSTNISFYSKRILADADAFEKKAFEKAKHIFTISEYLKNNIIDYYKINTNKISVVGTGRGIIEPYFGEKNYTNGKILFVAKNRFHDKGGSLVLEAFRKASKKNTNLKLIVVGQDEYLQNIGDKNIEVHGFVEKNELQELFNTAALFLLPAHYEPWGLVYLEALSCKVPIVGINKNSFPELSGYGKFGFGIENENAELLAQTIFKAFENPELLTKMGLAGQEYCLQNFSWENTTKKIVEGIQKYYV